MKSVKIGNQVWMQENLAIDDGDEGITYNPDNGQYYYTWDAAMRVATSINGWHLPSAEEWNTAAEVCGATIDPYYIACPGAFMLDYKNAQKLSDILMILYAGYQCRKWFINVWNLGCFWTGTESGNDDAYFRYFNLNGELVADTDFKYNRFTVRLVKD